MINSILATDMGVHFKYMQDLANLQEKFAYNGNTVDGWNPKMLEEYKDLTCGLLIKCADISNVVSIPNQVSDDESNSLHRLVNLKLPSSGPTSSRTSSRNKEPWSRNSIFQLAYLAALRFATV